jgi:hypothetical protein
MRSIGAQQATISHIEWPCPDCASSSGAGAASVPGRVGGIEPWLWVMWHLSACLSIGTPVSLLMLRATRGSAEPALIDSAEFGVSLLADGDPYAGQSEGETAVTAVRRVGLAVEPGEVVSSWTHRDLERRRCSR